MKRGGGGGILQLNHFNNPYFQSIHQNGHSGALGVLVHKLVAEVKEPERESATPLEARFPASGREQATGLDVVEKERSGSPVEIISVQLQVQN